MNNILCTEKPTLNKKHQKIATDYEGNQKKRIAAAESILQNSHLSKMKLNTI